MTQEQHCGTVVVVRIWDIRMKAKRGKTKCGTICEIDTRSASLRVKLWGSNVQKEPATLCSPHLPALLNTSDKNIRVTRRKH